MKTYSKIIVVLFTLVAGFTQAQAETKYVTDQFKVMMRSGEGVKHKILKSLPSGTALSLIGHNKETGYSQVRTKNGVVGYILTRQLMKTASARDRLTTIEAELKSAQRKPKRLSSELAKTQSQLKKVSASFSQLQQTKKSIAQELETIRRTAADAIRMSEERTKLRKNVVDLTRQIEDLKQENRDLSNQNARNWFLIGAAVIIAGILIGLILPRLHIQRRKDTWGSL